MAKNILEMMSKRASKYRKVEDFAYKGHVIAGLKRRPDGRFYAATTPAKTFGSIPDEAIPRFFRWRSEAAAGSIDAVGFDFWRVAFRRLILEEPEIAGEVLGIPQLAHLKYDPMTFGDVDWDTIIMPDE